MPTNMSMEKSMGASNLKTTMQSGCRPWFAVAAVIFAVALHLVTAKAQGGSAPNDAQIVGILLAADSIDIDYAKLATSKTHNKQVTRFAEQMITDHSSV